MALIDTAEDSLRLASISITKVEGEDRIVQQTLVDQAVERWDNPVDGDGIVSETQDTIKSAESEGKTWLLGGFRKHLILDLKITNGHMVLGNVSSKTSRAVVDLE